MFKNNSLQYTSLPTSRPKNTILLPQVTGIHFRVDTIDLTDSSFALLGTLTIRNQVSISLTVTYSNIVEYLYNNDETDDTYGYITHILDESSLCLDWQLKGNDTSFLKASCTYPIILEAVQTSDFIEQLLGICRDAYVKETVEVGILQQFLDQPKLTILVFFCGTPVCYDVVTKPLYKIYI